MLFFPDVMRRTGTLRIWFPNKAYKWKKGNQHQQRNVPARTLSSQCGCMLLEIRPLSLHEPKIHRVLVLYLSEAKDRFPSLDQDTTVAPQPNALAGSKILSIHA